MILGYGIVGPGESKRYMRKTLEEFQRLCDSVILLGNNITKGERDLIKEFGFKLVEDNREWGVLQWKIKQDFIENHVSKLVDNGDMLVCLDMDEVFCHHLSKEWIEKAQLDAYHVFIVDLWNDEQHYKVESCFWNVRIWRWNGETKFKQKPVHCGLAPEWAYHYHRFAPFILKHYGLMNPDDRAKKVLRYEKYDPEAKHLDPKFYEMLKTMSAKDFDENKMCTIIEEEVKTYKQTKPKTMVEKIKTRYAYIKNAAGMVLDIPEKDLEQTLKRPGMSFVGWCDDIEKEMEDLFEGVPLIENDKVVLNDETNMYEVKEEKPHSKSEERRVKIQKSTKKK